MNRTTKHILSIGLLSLLALSLVPGMALAGPNDGNPGNHHGDNHNPGNGYGHQVQNKHDAKKHGQAQLTPKQQRAYQAASREHQERLARLQQQARVMEHKMHQAHTHRGKLAARQNLARVHQRMERENTRYADLLVVRFGIVLSQITADSGPNHW